MTHISFSKRMLFILLALLLFLPGCGPVQTKRTKTFYEYFDTVSHIIAYENSEKDFEAACAAAEGILKSYHRLCDIYHEYSGVNNIKTVNDNAGVAPVTVAPEFIELLQYAVDMYDMTGGTVNVAMGAVLSLWHDCREAAAEGEAKLPDPVLLEAASQHCRIEDLVIDSENSTVYLTDPDMSLDLGAVAKGYATQKAADAIAAMGCGAYVLEIGGNVSALGAKPDGSPWSVGIQEPDPSAQSAYAETVSISGKALATSGTYQRYYELGGVRYHHIIDPDTLFPSERYLSVTVLCDDAGLADVLSTALFNMDLAAGRALAAGLDSVEAFWILTDGSRVQSAGFGEYTGE